MIIFLLCEAGNPQEQLFQSLNITHLQNFGHKVLSKWSHHMFCQEASGPAWTFTLLFTFIKVFLIFFVSSSQCSFHGFGNLGERKILLVMAGRCWIIRSMTFPQHDSTRENTSLPHSVIKITALKSKSVCQPLTPQVTIFNV